MPLYVINTGDWFGLFSNFASHIGRPLHAHGYRRKWSSVTQSKKTLTAAQPRLQADSGSAARALRITFPCKMREYYNLWN